MLGWGMCFASKYFAADAVEISDAVWKRASKQKGCSMKDLRFDDLYPPEYYMDVPGNDGRIAIKKFNDARDTMGFARFSLSYNIESYFSTLSLYLLNVSV